MRVLEACVKPRYDCSKCPGYCCAYDRIPISDFDLARLARHFDIPVATARRRFTYAHVHDGEREQLLRHHKDHVYRSVCRFFDRKARRCTVYAARPNVCRRYPSGARCGYYEFLTFEREQQGDEDFVPSA
ncbi:MAG: YkgJ family cysteine cluster protein [Proteobacteria bacterium]|nr:YkgJ family cysteine cluster protein [Pseudomonadota bacterium]